jgi:hypothetical protein
VTSVPGDSQVTVSWNTPDNSGGLPITGFIFRVAAKNLAGQDSFSTETPEVIAESRLTNDPRGRG